VFALQSPVFIPLRDVQTMPLLLWDSSRAQMRAIWPGKFNLFFRSISEIR